MTTPLPPKRRKAREALPPIYVVVDEDGELVSHHFYLSRWDTRDECECPGDRAVKYIPAPSRRAR